MIGRTLAHYRIESPLGQGGMGVVWRARDLHLERDVALKVLPEDALDDDAARRRFRREALALSRLNHPHIATVFDFNTQDGLDFLVMELVEGEPLTTRIARGALAEGEVRNLGAQIAAALEAAHEQGVVHRDLKPANVVLTAKGEVKLLDFGLAQLARPDAGTDMSRTLTKTGATLGTVPYMSPEQLMGRKVDARADLYALGVVLYELAAGRSPYRETVPTALVYEIVNQPVSPLREAVPEVSEALEAIVARCLAKEPESRYPSARELAADLADESRTVAALDVPLPTRARRRLRMGAAVAAIAVGGVLVAATALDLGGIRSRLAGAGRTNVINALAVLPLENLSRDAEQEYFADGMTDELITRLSQVSALRVISRTSTMQYKGTNKRLAHIARELRVDAVVTGSVLRSGERARITAQLTRAATDANLWADSFEGDLSDVLALQSQVARAIVDNVRVNLTPRDRAELASAPRIDPKVNEALLKGRYHVSTFSPEGWQRGLAYFKEAIRLDPTCAPAYAGLAETYTNMSNMVLPPREAMPKAKAAALKALALDPFLAEAHDVLAYVKAFYDWDWESGGREFRRAIELNPGRATVHRNYGIYLIGQRRFAEAATAIKRALEIDPLSTYLTTVSLWPLYEGRRYAEAIEAGEQLLREDSTLAFTRLVLGQALFMNGDRPRATAELRRAWRQEPSSYFRAWLAYALAADGQRDSALAIRDWLASHNDQQVSTIYSLAILHVALGETDRAFDLLDRAIEARAEDLVFLQVDPVLDPLRSDPRFADALRRVGFAPSGGRAQ